MASNATQLGLGALAAAAVGIGVIILVPPPGGDATDTAPTVPEPVAAAVEPTPAPVEPAPEPEIVDAPAAETPTSPEPEPEPEAEPVVAETADDPIAEPEPEPETAAVPEAKPGAAAETAAVAPELEGFFRIDDTIATVSGRGTPGEMVAIMIGGIEAAQAKVDANGAFAAVVEMAPSDAARRLTVMGDLDGARLTSAQSFIVAPTPAPATEPTPDNTENVVVAGAVTAPEPAPTEEPAETVAEASAAEEPTEAPEPVLEVADAPAEEDSETAIAESEPAAATPTSPAEEEPVVAEAEAVTPPTETEEVVADVVAEPDPEPASEPAAEAAPTVIAADEDGVRVVSGGAGPSVLSAIALDTISYDPAGEVVLAGRATGEGFVQVYLDNQPIRTTQIDAGNWQTELPDVDTGIYTLRVDEVDSDGAVVSRIETPFKREEPEAVAAVMAEDTAQDDFDVAVRTVQPGSTLWAIAREELGDGILYVAVFEANRDLIRDPDLIYPGQVFRIPEKVE